MDQGSISYPPSIDAAAITAFADLLEDTAPVFDRADDGIDGVAELVRRTWKGLAADTFGHHMNDRGKVFELASARVRSAVPALRALAESIEWSKRCYVQAVDEERRAVARNDVDGMERGRHRQESAVVVVTSASQRASETLAELAALLEGYVQRSFVAVGDRLGVTSANNGLFGQDLLIDALRATEDGRIDKDEIQIRQLGPKKFVVILPGVTDLSDNLATPWRWLTGGPLDRIRKTANANESAIADGTNPYALQVQSALQRAGIPDDSEITFVGHSYGSYTAIDLARNPLFNNVDGTSTGRYRAKVRNVFGFGADTDWKFETVPAATNVVTLNSRDDLVYQAETTFHPEPAEVLRRSVRPLMPITPWDVPSPFYRPTADTPSDRPNQMDVRINGGRQIIRDDWGISDDYGTGHHPRMYADAVPHVGPEVRALYDGLGTERVINTFNVRVPEVPVDRVPPVPPPVALPVPVPRPTPTP